LASEVDDLNLQGECAGACNANGVFGMFGQ
jgi:hypothetical protein